MNGEPGGAEAAEGGAGHEPRRPLGGWDFVLGTALR